MVWLPALEVLLNAFPLVIRGWDEDNGSEYVNKRVAKLLEKLLVEFTKSRARRTNDNALVEGKNGAVVRKHLGYATARLYRINDEQESYSDTDLFL